MSRSGRPSSERALGRLAFVLGVVGVLAACTAPTDTDIAAGRNEGPSGQTAAAPAPSPTEVHQRRECGSSIASFPATESSGPDAEDLTFQSIRDAAAIPADQLVPDDQGELPIFKLVAQVSDSADGPVTVRIAPTDRAVARLSYDSSQIQLGSIPLEEGASVVVFEPCDGLLTQYNGGFVVNGSRCVHITISNGDTGAETEHQLAFGVDASCG